MSALFRYRCILLAMVLCLGGARLLAQTSPSVAKRQEIVDALNTAVAAQSTSVIVTNVDLLDALTGCDAGSILNIELIHHPTPPSYFILRRKIQDGVTPGGPYTHPLVADLNNWLNAVFGMDMAGVPEFDALGWACGNPGQRYYTQSTSNLQSQNVITATVAQDAVDALKEMTGENRMLNKYYNINGTMVKGSDLLTFSEGGTRTVKFLTDLGTGQDPVQRRLLAAWYLKVGCPEETPNVELTFDSETYPYAQDCGITDPNTPVGLISAILYRSTHLQIDTAGCRFSMQGGTSPEPRNNSLFDVLIDNRNRWKVPGPGETDPYVTVDDIGGFGITADGFLYFKRFYSNLCVMDSIALCRIIDTTTTPDEYCETKYCYGGTFALDATKHLVYNVSGPGCGEDCSSQPVPCIEFCDHGEITMPTVSNVIAADARTFSDGTNLLPADLFPSAAAYDSPNAYEKGEKGKWRMFEQYAYRASIKAGSGQFSANSGQASERNYNDAGVFNLQLFGSKDATNDPAKWLRVNWVSRYSQNGEPVQEENILGIPNAAVFGYGQQLPIAVGKNASNSSIYFESFDNDFPALTPAAGSIVTDVAHSGRSSYKLPGSGTSDPKMPLFGLDYKGAQDGLLIKLWTKNGYPSGSPTAYDKQCPVGVTFVNQQSPINSFTINGSSFRFVAKTGEWSLFEAEVSHSTLGDYNIEFIRVFGSIDIWVDDVRIQPLTSEMACYVYDPNTLKPIVVFDDQHFGMFYQYNGEGKLIRTIKETMRGKKTVQENQYHLPLIARNYGSSNVSSSVLHDEGGDVSQSASRVVLNGHRFGQMTSVTDSGFKVGMLDVELGLNRRDVKVFGVDIDELGDRIDSLKRFLERPSIAALRIPELDKLRLLESLESADSAVMTLSTDAAGAGLDSAGVAAKRSAIRAAERRRAEIIRKLGISEDEAKEIMANFRALKSSIEEKIGPSEKPEQQEQ